MTRLWLTNWEWACCGDSFVVGDSVDFGVSAREGNDGLVRTLGAELAATVDAAESHHEEELFDRVVGVVSAVYAVSQEFVERRALRRPGHGAPADALLPTDSATWPMVRQEIGDGVFVGARPSRYIVVSESVPGTVTLHLVRGVRLPAPTDEEVLHAELDIPAPTAEPTVETRGRRLTGWLVDVDEYG